MAEEQTPYSTIVGLPCFNFNRNVLDYYCFFLKSNLTLIQWLKSVVKVKGIKAINPYFEFIFFSVFYLILSNPKI